MIGDTVNVASRIEGLTGELGHPVLVSEATHRRLHPLACRRLPPMPVKGKAEPVALYAPILPLESAARVAAAKPPRPDPGPSLQKPLPGRFRRGGDRSHCAGASTSPARRDQGGIR